MKNRLFLHKNRTMIVSIKIENQRDYQWLLPFLEALKKNTNAKVEIKSNDSTTEKAWDEKLNEFFQFAEARAVNVEKVEHLTRDELNER